jgi:cytochrome oxidase assembly protein ShyY1
MYRFLVRPKWIAFTVVVVAAVVAMANLSLWQLRRLDQRQQFNELVAARLAMAPVPLQDPGALGLEDEWTTVNAAGIYDGTEQLEPAAGSYRVIGRLVLAGGAGTILVERGSIPSTMEDAPPTPTGTVEIVGRVRRAPSTFGVLAPNGAGPTMIVQVDASTPSDDPSLTPAPLPNVTDEGSHLSYAVQWAIFAVCVAIGWVLAVRRSARSGSGAGPGGPVVANQCFPSPAPKRSKHHAVPWRD